MSSLRVQVYMVLQIIVILILGVDHPQPTSLHRVLEVQPHHPHHPRRSWYLRPAIGDTRLPTRGRSGRSPSAVDRRPTPSRSSATGAMGVRWRPVPRRRRLRETPPTRPISGSRRERRGGTESTLPPLLSSLILANQQTVVWRCC